MVNETTAYQEVADLSRMKKYLKVINKELTATNSLQEVKDMDQALDKIE